MIFKAGELATLSSMSLNPPIGSMVVTPEEPLLYLYKFSFIPTCFGWMY